MADKYSNRYIHIWLFTGLLCFLLLATFFYLQICNERYPVLADRNVFVYDIQYPARGLIYDRSKQILVSNRIVYDLFVTPNMLKSFDTVFICHIFSFDKVEFRNTLKAALAKGKKQNHPSHYPLRIYRNIPDKIYYQFLSYNDQFPAFAVDRRTDRSYPFPIAANLIGYLGESDLSVIQKDPFYITGSQVGKIGLENMYEKILRGQRGTAIHLRDKYNKVRSRYKDGILDTIPIPGKDIITTIDKDLQNLGEYLMKGKIGSIVAIEPETGEILAMVSMPTFYPDVFSLAAKQDERDKLRSSEFNPMLNRSVMARYPPGSIFKTMNALVGLQERIIYPTSSYYCSGGYKIGRHTVKCHPHKNPCDVSTSIAVSCNTYYCNLFRLLMTSDKYSDLPHAYTVWRNHLRTFGMGEKLKTDVFNELSSLIPTAEYFQKIHKRSWKYQNTISMAIGQGELLVTPLHMANFAAIIGNRGHYYTPHLVKKIQDTPIDTTFLRRHVTSVDPRHFESVVEGMYRVVQSDYGTARRWRYPTLEICGKTGTAQNPHGEDHSVYICFSPKHNPKIAMSVYVENGGGGSGFAAAIASLMVEQYLNGKITRTDMATEFHNTAINYQKYEQKRPSGSKN